jgi:translation initiation factor IF-1
MKRVLARNVRVPAAAAAVGARSRIIAGKSGVDLAAGAQTSAALFATAKVFAHLKSTMTDSEKALELEGTIMSVLPGTMFRVALANDHLVLAHISGKMRKRFIRLTVGDRVRMQMSPYDTAKARIVYRL